MASFLEFALFAWLGISVIAVFIQLIRIARYKRRVAKAETSPERDSKPEAATIDLSARERPESPTPTAAPSQVMAGAEKAEQPAPQQAAAASAPSAIAKVTMPRPPAAPVTATAATPAAQEAPTPAVQEAPATAPDEVAAPTATPTLADLLAGVRLPWNLLPTVDQGREPSNDRVVLITDQGEPSEIGVDVADELERLGFVISPRGDDTAVATRDGQSLGLRIIEEPMTAEVEGTRRFPTATESSVALDIWVE